MTRFCFRFFLLVLTLTLSFSPAIAAEAKPKPTLVGVASADITPSYPIRLCGYASRRTESAGVAQRLTAKAVAIGSDKDGPAILLTVDNTGVPKSIRDEVAQYLAKQHKIDDSRVALCSSHSHTAPCLAGNLPTLFGEPLPPEHEEHIQRYTRELVETLKRISDEALKNRRPARLAWGQGQAGFAKNRRTKGGPVDHDLPVMSVTDEKGALKAVLLNYACHCTTLGGETNWICGDWAGYAQDYLEKDHPGATVMVMIGCGADSNPDPRTGLGFAQQHGNAIETAVNEVLGRTLHPLSGKLECHSETVELPFEKPRTQAEWEQLSKGSDKYMAYYAKVNLARVEKGEELRTKLPYLVQSWSFGKELAMVFLPGEVVVDYSLRLKNEFDPARLWVTAYANDVPCYVPSERILKEGGYEGGGAMMYYNQPNRFAPGLENIIVNAVHQTVPKRFATTSEHAEFPKPQSPAQSMAGMQTRSGLELQLVASEPLIVDPVAIDWGADGRLRVVEMRDYPSGMDGNWKPGSRIKYLEDTNGDGRYDKATVVADNLPFATGVTAWRSGALVCSAPDILYVEDRNFRKGKSAGGKPEVATTKLFTGFYTDNYQARVNSISLGLDNWMYGANGLLGGVIHGESSGLASHGGAATPLTVDIRGRDFRMHPDTGEFEPVSGLTQQGRARDDWGDWFGCDNSTLAWHYPLPDHYVRRNAHVAAPSPRVAIAGGPDPTLLHPLSRTLERFNHPESAGHVTSGCGLGLYRDTLLGEQYYGDAFVCDPVHNLVHRLKLHDAGVTFSALRAPGEEESEFLAARDNWSRPVQVRTGPDGALYVVDMYRFVIEHPRWIAPERLAKLDVRAGDNMGRIYRLAPKGAKLRAVADLTHLPAEKLAVHLDSPNGTERDRVHQEILSGQRTWSASEQHRIVEVMERLATANSNAAVRLQAACVLDGLGKLNTRTLVKLMHDKDKEVRANAIRLSEPVLRESAAKGRAGSPLPAGTAEDSSTAAARSGVRALPLSAISRADVDQYSRLTNSLLWLANDADIGVRFQLALSLGEWNDPQAGAALGAIAAHDCNDSWVRAAVLSSAVHQPAEILDRALAVDPKQHGRSELIRDLLATIVGAGDQSAIAKAVRLILPADPAKAPLWQLTAVTTLSDSLQRKKLSLTEVIGGGDSTSKLLAWARTTAADKSADEQKREAAIRLLARDKQSETADVKVLAQLVGEPSEAIQKAAFDRLKQVRAPETPSALLGHWETKSPAVRQSIISLLLAREAWVKPLLAAVQANTVGLNEIPLPARQQLLHHKNTEIAQAAKSIWASQQNTRAEILARYQPATTLAGDAGKGATAFANTCSTCHELRGVGHAVGPALTPIADKTPADFLTAILDPNAAVEPRYVAYNIELRDGRSLSGVVNAETGTTLTLVQGGGVKESILRNDIESIRASGLSLMPEGLEQTLKPQDIADLIAYIKSSPRVFGSATPEQAAEAQRKFIASGPAAAQKIMSGFDPLPYGSWLGSLPLHFCRQTDGQSKVSWESSATVPAANDTTVFRFPAAMGWSTANPGTFTLTVNGQSPLKFTVTLNDQQWQSADGRVRMDYTVRENNAEDSNGTLTISVDKSLIKTGEPIHFEVVGSATQSQRWFGIYELATTTRHAAK
jgi:putative membrane-bound dehydrogenase-like protein